MLGGVRRPHRGYTPRQTNTVLLQVAFKMSFDVATMIRLPQNSSVLLFVLCVSVS